MFGWHITAGCDGQRTVGWVAVLIGADVVGHVDDDVMVEFVVFAGVVVAVAADSNLVRYHRKIYNYCSGHVVVVDGASWRHDPLPGYWENRHLYSHWRRPLPPMSYRAPLPQRHDRCWCDEDDDCRTCWLRPSCLLTTKRGATKLDVGFNF